MTLGKYLFVAVAVAGMLTPAVAADKNRADFTLGAPAQISSQTIKAGEYTAEWEGSGPSVQVKILRGSKVVATSNANLVKPGTPVKADQVIVHVDDNGSRTVQQLNFASRKLSLVFADNAMASGQ
jgi:hypothetical protein